MKKSSSSPAVVKQLPHYKHVDPWTTSAQDFGRHQRFDSSKLPSDGKYSRFSERVTQLVENPVPIDTVGRGTYKFSPWRTTYQDSLPRDFDEAKLGDKYANFSNKTSSIAEKADAIACADPAKVRWKTTYQDLGGGFDMGQLQPVES